MIRGGAVRKFKLKKWVAAGLMVSLPYASVVDAAGLGRLNVLSQLGQPFAAEIDLVNVSREELATLKANLASPAAYQAANLQFNPALNALRLSVERRANGTSYIKATSFRPVAEPFLDLLIELSWQGGKIVREYSALLDPPGMDTPAAATTTPPVVAAPAQAPAPAPAVRPAPAPTPTEAPAPAAKPARAPAPAAAPASQYAVKYGDTLSGIARQVGPEGVSLEQTLIGLFRANPDAFVGSNINQLRAGKILNVPEREKLAAIAQGEAAQEVQVHAANWNAYRRKVADSAPAVAEAAPSAKGKITARVDDKAGGVGPKDVVVLSKGDTGPGGAAGKSAGDRVRALEEDLAAREKALAESKERVAQLEKTLKEMQKLAEIKNPAAAAAVQQSSKGPEPKPDVKVEAKPEAKAEAPKVEPAKSETPKPEAKEDAPKADVAPPKPAAAVPPKAITPPPPPPEPSLMDTVMENILPIGGGALALLAGIGGIWALRRRKQDEDADQVPVAPSFKSEPYRNNVETLAAPVAAATEPLADATVANVTDVVDPIDEAQVYIDHGRDTQAEEILTEAHGKYPAREDIPLKLLEVFAARGDKAAFNKAAEDFHKQTGGAGENWARAAVLGHAIDPTNPLYPSTGEVVDFAAVRDSAAGVDLDLGGTAEAKMGSTTDILLDQGKAGDDMEKTMVLTRDDMKAATQEIVPGAVPDFNIELPADSAAETPTQPVSSNMLEFNIDLPAEPAPQVQDVSAAETKPVDAGLDFKVDFSNINLNLDDAPAAPADASGAKDAHWEDVQQKFDLARAYQEMGDKEGALEILHEVEREGDAEQKAEAQKMIQSLK